ncbi:uncharacterized protein DDB_G0271670-like [Chenopodium quinoa]|uniref:uncharacterized protein DDB_G0271670-like n=1 Tax=Chenopodium quinoa TaxID=63459 RepID=UPI000B78A81C|nr:uncharacterized protein DDB_G0271670-like [Chenopodium quinoa]
MGKQEESKINFQLIPTPEEMIAANNFEQKKSCNFYNKSQKLSLGGTSSSSSSSISSCDSTTTFESNSSSSSDLMEDATSTSSSSTDGPLFHLSDLMDKLPIKKGLSKYYSGKSESFTSLASVENLEDLVKRENPYRKKMKLCRSYYSPKPTISKKVSYSRNSFSRNCSSNLMSSACRSPSIPPMFKEF